jgi:hypothetical protein
MQYVLTYGNPRDFHANMYEIDGPINIVFIKVYNVLSTQFYLPIMVQMSQFKCYVSFEIKIS